MDNMDNFYNDSSKEPVNTTFTTAPEAPVYTAIPAAPAQDNSMKAMIFGILGLALSESGILGLIFAILGLKQANIYNQKFGTLTGKAKVGHILSKIGLILSIVCLVIYVIAFIIGIFAGLTAANFSDGSYYYY